jgi:hypothetical protein
VVVAVVMEILLATILVLAASLQSAMAVLVQ